MEQPRRSGYQTEHASASVALAGKTVADVLACWPQTAAVFMHNRLACVGCSLSRFERIGDVAAVYGLDLACFVQELRQAAVGLDSNRDGSRVKQGSKAE